MPTDPQIDQINSVNNDISVDPDPVNNFYKSSNNTIRCQKEKCFKVRMYYQLMVKIYLSLNIIL